MALPPELKIPFFPIKPPPKWSALVATLSNPTLPFGTVLEAPESAGGLRRSWWAQHSGDKPRQCWGGDSHPVRGRAAPLRLAQTVGALGSGSAGTPGFHPNALATLPQPFAGAGSDSLGTGSQCSGIHRPAGRDLGHCQSHGPQSAMPSLPCLPSF